MESNQNPYYPGAGIRPAALTGRDSDIADFEVAVTRLANQRPARGVILTGLRGMGKTVLLGKFTEIALANGWESESLEATADTGFAGEVGERINRMIRYINARHSPIRSRFEASWRRASDVVRTFQLRWQSGDVELAVSLDGGIGGTGDLKTDLIDLFGSLGQLASDAGTGALLTIDEMHNLARSDLTALIAACHHVSQRRFPVLLAGAGLPSLPGRLTDAQTYAERLFGYRNLGELDEAASAAALVEAASAEGVEWDPRATKFIVDASMGYPYFLQELGRFTWDVAPGPDRITLADAEQAVPLAQTYLDSGFLRYRIDPVPRVELQYLHAMADLGGGPYRTADIARSMGKSNRDTSGPRRRLIKRGLIYSPATGLLDFTVPMLDQYLSRHRG